MDDHTYYRAQKAAFDARLSAQPIHNNLLGCSERVSWDAKHALEQEASAPPHHRGESRADPAWVIRDEHGRRVNTRGEPVAEAGVAPTPLLGVPTKRARAQEQRVRAGGGSEEATHGVLSVTDRCRQVRASIWEPAREDAGRGVGAMGESAGGSRTLGSGADDVPVHGSIKDDDGGGTHARTRPRTRCYNCGKVGHMAKECTAPKGAGGVAAMPASDKIRMVIPYMMQNHKVGKRRGGGLCRRIYNV